MAWELEVHEGDTLTRTMTLLDAEGEPVVLTTATLEFARTTEADVSLLGKSTADATKLEYNAVTGVLSIHFLAADYASLPHINGHKIGSVRGTEYAGTLRIDGDVPNGVGNGTLKVYAAVPATAA